MSHESPSPPTPQRPRGRVALAVLVVAAVLAGIAAIVLPDGALSLPDRFTLTGPARGKDASPEATARAFAAYLESHPDGPAVTGLAEPGERERIHCALVAFYGANDHRPAWFGRRKPSAEARGLVELLRRADRDGLDPARYRPELLASRIEGLGRRPGPREIYPVDTLLSQAFALYGRHLAAGRVDPTSLGPVWLMEPRRVRLEAALREAADGGGPEAVAERLRPPHQGYGQLLELLARYRRIAAEGGWPAVPEGPVLAEGDRAPAARLQALAARLAVEGDLEDLDRSSSEPALRDGLKRPSAETAEAGGDTDPTAVFGPTLAAAVHRFQERHGITEDGKVGPETMAALNVSAARRAGQIVLNLERWRWLPGELGERRVEVNLPGYALRMVEGERTAGTMKVVVGKTGAATPAFSDLMSYVGINPYWNVPAGITAAEIAPQAAADPSWLARNGYEVVTGWGEDASTVDPRSVDWSAAGGGGFPYLVRQRPGPGNALGTIKFMFPNQLNIYLHDTPAAHLFDEVERTFSHGCIRVERPLDLAEFLFRGDPEWDRSRIEGAIASGARIDVALPHKVPVYLLYWTAWMDEDGRAHFRKDIYGHDRALARALTEQRRGAEAARTASR